MDSFKRKTPEEILHSISKLHQGRLKIIIGAVSGSGKTYHMLREGQQLKREGIDVVICAVSTSRRPETVEQLADLERVPSIHWMDGSIERKDLNLDELVARNPEAVLVDSLAHRNREHAQFPTRLEDIRFLLGHGISVITTINVYELEGVHLLAREWTGVEAECTVPVDTLELADEVRLIDVSPETLLKRMEEGNVSSSRNAGLFQRGNLGVLRELALRLVAEDVNGSLEKYREELGLIGPSGATERILVSVQYHWNSSLYIRRGQQIARRLNAELLVVTFASPNRELSSEKAALKRSILKLSDKVQARFEELSLPARRLLPTVLVRYALDHHVTRIVLGHSRQSRWQEWWQGSITNRILRKTHNIDLFLVADSALREGERILPAKAAPPKESGLFRRLSTVEVEQRIDEITRGRFKILIGAAPGVGKTYAMLREGNSLLSKGIDVVIGLLETHGRADTAAQVGMLTQIERAQISYQGVQLEEMNADSIIKRNPEVVLIDELAHTNIPGSHTKKRFEDVIRILEAGISVIATVNVQHLESLNDAVEQLTGVRVRETVPDYMLRMADEVELIDVTPQSLQQRMREGRIYAPDKVNQALGAFFKIGNLIALRELALREIADDVDERLEAWQRKNALRGPWRRKEVIFVCVDLNLCAEKLVRRGFRIAYRLKATWYVSYTDDGRSRSAEQEKKLSGIRDLTERLGGIFMKLQAKNRQEIVEVIVQQTTEIQATQLIVGQPLQVKWWTLRRSSVVHQLLRRTRHIDMLVVANSNPHVR
ncbi:MAG: histidine kinase [Paenibacillus sp.]|nr:histidine kinase [Paenibacillus sp.]